MADDLDVLADDLNRLIVQERFAEAQALLPKYTRALDRCLRDNGGEEALKRAVATFQDALTKARTARAHIAIEISDLNRARAYTGESAADASHVQLIG
jgi:hypothetical protein